MCNNSSEIEEMYGAKLEYSIGYNFELKSIEWQMVTNVKSLKSGF